MYWVKHSGGGGGGGGLDMTCINNDKHLDKVTLKFECEHVFQRTAARVCI